MTYRYNPGSRFRPSSPYDYRINPLHGDKNEFHAGQDFSAPAGTPIPAATPGRVIFSGPNAGFGNVVVVKNNSGGYSLYGHMQDGERAALGQRVWAGDILGSVGSTGRSTGSHLHYSVITDEAGKDIEDSHDPRDRGSLGVRVIKDTTTDPAEYDPEPRFLDGTHRAAEILSAANVKAASGTPPSSRENWLNGRFAKWGSAPANVAPPPASDSPESFDNRFGSWGSRPANGFGENSSPVLRFLEQYHRAVAPAAVGPASDVPLSSPLAPALPVGAPSATVDDKQERYLGRRVAGEPTVFDTGAPPLPFAPSLAPLSPDHAPHDPAGDEEDRLWFLQGWR
jgi:murein DD-endopeptidase MepM/ murein hydrolase activator NlpD